MVFENQLRQALLNAVKQLFESDLSPEFIQIQKTRPGFEGHLTIVVFPITRISKKPPEETARLIGNHLAGGCSFVQSFNTIKGFLNIVLKDSAWLNQLREAWQQPRYGFSQTGEEEDPVVVEYSSPNTNKPLHLGHIRNNLLGWSVAEILKAAGHRVVKVNLINDRGIHICKSMLAWKKTGNGETPLSGKMKGDHLVGKYYVEFDRMVRSEKQQLMASGLSEQEAENRSETMQQVRQMLRLWEAGDPDTINLWKMMNGWVYEGFEITYKNLGVDFDKIYYESETYLLGKQIVEEGLKNKVFYKKPDGSVWIDLTADGLDEKLVLRSDGTAVYITQDIGTAKLRYDDYRFSKMIYVVGNEQDYHFKVLKLITARLGYEWAGRLYHLSYGMVDLPSGKMKSREGTVVDADELLDELFAEAERITRELGKIDNFESSEAQTLYRQIALGALKYFLLRVDPEKRMLFNPAGSIDFNGDTGPFIQYTYARIQSVVRKAAATPDFSSFPDFNPDEQAPVNKEERDLIIHLLEFPFIIQEAAQRLSPALIAHYAFSAARLYNQFYHHHPILDKDHLHTSLFRIRLSAFTGYVLKSALHLLGIQSPERM